MSNAPDQQLRHWGPHLLVLMLAVVILTWMLAVLAPVRNPILDGAALAVLTHPLLFTPLDRLLRLLPLPSLTPDRRRALAAAGATLCLAAILGGLVLLVLASALGGMNLTLGAIWGVVTHDPQSTSVVIDRLVARAADLLTLYPALPGDAEDLRPLLVSLLGVAEPGSDLLRWVVTGTGGLVTEILLAAATLFYLYQRGGRLAHRLLAALPLDLHARATMRRQLRVTTGVLVGGALARAGALGLAVGLLAWAIGGFAPVLVGVIGVLAGLLPAIGPFFIWVPLASLLAGQGRWVEAVCLAVAIHAAAWLINLGLARWHLAYARDRLWLNYVLFLAVVGGVLGDGLRGLLLGPAAVVAGSMVLDLLGSLYGARTIRREPTA
jgi:predicted PurR-regulated permease PerM